MAENYQLSVIIPARNEMFLRTTVENILVNKRAKTEIIVVLDGEWANPPLIQHPDVNVIYVPESIGQRAATNLGAKLSRARYIMKLDAHCSWDEGYDEKMIQGFKKVGDNVTMVGIMRNLWMFDWNCRDCNWKKYQGPTPEKCEKCGGTNIRRKMMVVGKRRPQSYAYSFDPSPHFRYWNRYVWKPECKEELEKTGCTETMSLQGSCFMLTRKKYWELDICGKNFGSWGNQGIETACKTWLSGGRVMVNHQTWYAHLFRTQGGDFSFPYKQPGGAVVRTKRNVWNSFFDKSWAKQIHPMSWLVEKFWPVPGWDEKSLAELKDKEKQNGK